MKLTKKMFEILLIADLDRAEINDVPMSTMYAFESRGLIDATWRKSVSRCVQTSSDSFPVFSKVKLTIEGVRAARTTQGLTAQA